MSVNRGNWAEGWFIERGRGRAEERLILKLDFLILFDLLGIPDEAPGVHYSSEKNFSEFYWPQVFSTVLLVQKLL
jgi:hypothetical protein